VLDLTTIKSLSSSGIRSQAFASFQKAVCQTLLIKTKRAIEQTGIRQLVVSGGVSANIQLRQDLKQMLTSMGGKVFFPRQEFCTDNGAMVAYLGWRQLQETGLVDGDLEINVHPRWEL